jgi:adenylosuccinate synthase
VNSSVSGLCITKLDVLDGLDPIRICVGYRIKGLITAEPPLSVEGYADVEPVYEELPGWRESTGGITDYQALPGNARRYLERLAHLVAVPIEMISTGPDREQTVVLQHPFGA